MTDLLDSDERLLADSLRARVDDVRPDLAAITSGATRAGGRIRTRRRVTVGLAAAACVGLGAAGVAALPDRTPEAVETPGFAATPDDDTLRVGQKLDLGRGLTGTVTREDDRTVYQLGDNLDPGPGSGYMVVVGGPLRTIEQEWSSGGFGNLYTDWPGVAVAVSLADADAMGMMGRLDQPPVTVPEGWTCEWALVDDKAGCESADGDVAGLVIRDAADHAAWVGNPDKGGSRGVFTTEPHGEVFISVQAGRGMTGVELKQFGESLTWIE